MPRYIASNMTAAEFVAWCTRHGITYKNCHQPPVCMSEESFYRYRSGKHIPGIVGSLCAALDQLQDVKFVSPWQLAKLMADNRSELDTTETG